MHGLSLVIVQVALVRAVRITIYIDGTVVVIIESVIVIVNVSVGHYLRSRGPIGHCFALVIREIGRVFVLSHPRDLIFK